MSAKRCVSVLVIFAVLFVAAPVMAASGWYTCNVGAVGMIVPCTTFPNGAVQFQLADIDGTFANSFFVVDNEVRKMFLSICLTAISTGREVVVYLDPVDTMSLVQVHIRTCDNWPCQ